VRPWAVEQCNGRDDDCEGGTDEDGTTLCDDLQFCTTDTCQGTGGCRHDIQADKCVIQGVCYAGGDPKPGSPCTVCTPSKSRTAWNTAADGTACGTGKKCQSGQCVTGG